MTTIELPGATLHQGDCLEVLRTRVPDESIDLIVTSPPCNCRVPYTGYHDQRPWNAYYAWMTKVLMECYRVLVPGGTLAVVVPGVVRWQADHEHADTWDDYDPTCRSHRTGEKICGKGRVEPLGFHLWFTMREIDPHLREPIIWVKGGKEGQAHCTRYQMGCDSDPYMRPAHEMILLGSKGQWFHRGGTGQRGAKAVPFLEETKDVWFIPARSSPAHPATFPREIPRRLISLFIHAADGVVGDPFMGIGTTGEEALAAQKQFVGIELSEEYFRVARSTLDVQATQLRLF